MSWLWSSERSEQAQIVVSALQGELDDREARIQALQSSLKREQEEFKLQLRHDVAELQERRKLLTKELEAVEELIREKESILGNAPVESIHEGTHTDPSGTIQEVHTSSTQEEIPSGMPIAAQSNGKKSDASMQERKPQPPQQESVKPSVNIPVLDEVQRVQEQEPNVAFIIQRSTNSNTVVYAGKVKNGSASKKYLDEKNALDIYWIMYEQKGHPREELNMLERNSAYGASCKRSKRNKQEFVVTLSALKDREITLYLDEQGSVRGKTTINGEPGMILQRVFVKSTSSWGLPTVEYIELFGFNPATGQPVYEKKLNK